MEPLAKQNFEFRVGAEECLENCFPAEFPTEFPAEFAKMFTDQSSPTGNRAIEPLGV